MRARLAVSLLVVLLLIAKTDLPAQETQTLDTTYAAERIILPGSRVRIVAPTLFAELLDGTIEALRPDTLLLRFDAEDTATAVVPVASVERLEVFQGSRAPYGEIFGTIGGMLAGGLLAYELAPSGRSAGEELSRSFYVAVGVFLGGGAGYLVGKQLDKAVFGETWKEVPVSRILWETRLQPQVSAYPDGRLVIALSFYH
jgi:hypothetical protein